MTRVLVVAGLLATVGLWGWALFVPKPLEPLPEEFRGVFRLYRFEPPDGEPMPNPFPAGHTHTYTFLEDGAYELSITVSRGYEMIRREGVVEVDDDGVMTLHQYSENRRELPGAPESFSIRWAEDADGKFLLLRHEQAGYFLYLRPVE